ncbi:MAG: winged helix-turn-helix domain-containing protein [archaeon]
MDQETLFTGSKWDILKLLGQKKMSPLELARKSGTSTANISQQLRFLEMAGIVTSQRIPNRDKGQPRILYSLSGNNSFLISVAPGFVNKGLQTLNQREQAILKIWFYNNKESQYFLERAFLSLDKYLPEIDAVAIDESKSSQLTLTVVSSNGLAKKLNPNFSIESPHGDKRTVKFNVINKQQIKPADHYGIYDPQILFGG